MARHCPNCGSTEVTLIDAETAYCEACEFEGRAGVFEAPLVPRGHREIPEHRIPEEELSYVCRTCDRLIRWQGGPDTISGWRHAVTPEADSDHPALPRSR